MTFLNVPISATFFSFLIFTQINVAAGKTEVGNNMDGKWSFYLFTNPGATLRNCSTPC
jgi:hypothetical protein